jgi:hypothetical protein
MAVSKIRLAFVLVGVLLVGGGYYADKPAAAPLAGDNGQMGKVYSLGRQADALHFTLESARFALRAEMLHDTILAKAGQKLLILRIAVQNPRRRDALLHYTTFSFTVVAPDDKNIEWKGKLYHPGRFDEFNTTLKPAQKVRALVVIPIHGIGPVNKLIVRKGSATPLLRYDLRGKVEPLTGPFASNDGVDALDTATVEGNGSFPFGAWDMNFIRVVKLEKAGPYKPKPGEKLYGIVMGFSNHTRRKTLINYTLYAPGLASANNQELKWERCLLLEDSFKPLAKTLAPGSSATGMYLFSGPGEADPTALTLRDGNSGRELTIKLGT